ncbi:hypothetical protein JCM8547_004927 [Rhodosporidiobolus lusitaniae]
MLLSLPDELIENIVRLVLPGHMTERGYEERQALLRALCLMSKRLHLILLPILEEAASGTTPNGYIKVTLKQHKDTSKLKYLSMKHPSPAPFSNLSWAWTASSSLRKLCLSNFEHVDMRYLEGLNNLRRLDLQDVFVTDSPFHLRNLTELGYVSSKPNWWPHDFFLAAFFPSLKHVALDIVSRASYTHVSFMDENLTDRLIRLTCYPSVYLCHTYVRVRPVDQSVDVTPEWQTEIHLITDDELEKMEKQDHPTRIHLPLEYHPDLADDPYLREKVTRFLAICQRLAIDIDFEDSHGMVLPTAFLRHAER